MRKYLRDVSTRNRVERCFAPQRGESCSVVSKEAKGGTEGGSVCVRACLWWWRRWGGGGGD